MVHPSCRYWLNILLLYTYKQRKCFLSLNDRVGIQMPVAMLLRINVNYTLWPPPGFTDGHLISGSDYHLWMTIMLMLTAWVAGYRFLINHDLKFFFWFDSYSVCRYPLVKLAQYLSIAFSPYYEAESKKTKVSSPHRSTPTTKRVSSKRS